MSAFREQAERFAGKNAQVLGVSKDDLETLRRFAQSLSLPYPLGSDGKGQLTAAYGVDGGAMAKRATFVIGPDGTIEKVFEGAAALDPTGALEACPLHRGAKPARPDRR